MNTKTSLASLGGVCVFCVLFAFNLIYDNFQNGIDFKLFYAICAHNLFGVRISLISLFNFVICCFCFHNYLIDRSIFFCFFFCFIQKVAILSK
jgi:hypothetical protein